MVNNLSPIRPSRGGESVDKPGRTKPLGQPRDDNFRKLAKDRRPSKEEEEIAAEEPQETESPPSLFELSKSKNTLGKGTSSKKSSPFDQPSSRTRSPLDKDQQLGTLEEEPSSQEDLMPVEKESKEAKLFAHEENLFEDENAPLKTRSPKQSVEQPAVLTKQPSVKQPSLRGEQLAASTTQPSVEDEQLAVPTKQPSVQGEQPRVLTKKPSTRGEQPAINKGAQSIEKEIAAETGENVLFEPELEPDLEQVDSKLLAANEDKGVKDKAQVPANELNRQQAATLHAQRSKSPELEESPKKPVVKKEKGRSESSSEKTDALEERAKLAVNASIQAAELQTDAGKAQLQESQASRASTIREIAAQIVESIQIMRKDDLTTTLVTLRHPPILEGATISLTTSDHAKREFNISFANLSPQAKLFIDRKLNEDSLTATLERKGIIVHMLTTTTQPETLIKTESGQATRDQETTTTTTTTTRARTTKARAREGRRRN